MHLVPERVEAPSLEAQQTSFDLGTLYFPSIVGVSLQLWAGLRYKDPVALDSSSLGVCYTSRRFTQIPDNQQIWQPKQQ